MTPPGAARRMHRFAAATWQTALDLVLPRTCPGCYTPGSWCDTCAATLSGRPRPVPLPPAALDRLAAAGLPAPPVHALSRYTGPVRAAILAGKERGRRDLPPLLGRALGAGLALLQDAAVLPGGLWLIPAPTRPAAARARGGDPVLAMARSAASLLAERGRATGVAPCLSLANRTRDSVGLDATARAANLATALRFDPTAAPPDYAAGVLLDDVLTSGATVTASLAVLAAHRVWAAGVLVLASAIAPRPSVLRRRAGRPGRGGASF